MITIKSPHEIEIMREAGRIVAECHQILSEKVKPGVTTEELDKIVEEHIRKRKAVPSFKGHQGFPASICVAINDVVCHGIPGQQVLNQGDIITIDVGAYYKGYHGDSAWTYPVGKISKVAKDLMETGEKCLKLGIEQAVIDNRIGDIGRAIDDYAQQHKRGVVRSFTGHGVGKRLWEDPPIPHYSSLRRGAKIKEGMTLAIEPMITLGDWRIQIMEDNWTAKTLDHSLCVQYEHTIAISEKGPIILTTL